MHRNCFVHLNKMFCFLRCTLFLVELFLPRLHDSSESFLNIPGDVFRHGSDVQLCIYSSLLGGELSGFFFVLHSLKAAVKCWQSTVRVGMVNGDPGASSFTASSSRVLFAAALNSLLMFFPLLRAHLYLFLHMLPWGDAV